MYFREIIGDEDKWQKIRIIVKKRIDRLIKRKKYASFGSGSTILKPMRIIGRSSISIGKDVTVFDGIRMECIKKWHDSTYTPSLVIGDRTTVQQSCHITCANKIHIGVGVSILPNVLVTDIEHIYEPGKSIQETGIKIGEVLIGDYVTIGMGARILGGKKIEIGKNSVIGTNAVVTHDIPPNSIVAGVPAVSIGVNQPAN